MRAFGYANRDRDAAPGAKNDTVSIAAGTLAPRARLRFVEAIDTVCASDCYQVGKPLQSEPTDDGNFTPSGEQR